MRQIVIASGKGGTGKTTVTAAFARIAAGVHPVVVADTDVEASNLPLALGVTDETCEQFAGGAEAVVEPSACTACGVCEPLCVFDAIAQAADGRYAVDALTCEGCGRCASACPSGAIVMHARTAGSACVGTCRTGGIAYGQLTPGQDLSGKLVTEVRRRAAKRAEATSAELLLIDGPPGVGCPLIAAMSSTDLLVAVAEPSVSGVHDLGRLAELASRLKIQAVVVLNKADLSEPGAQQVRALCTDLELPIVAEVPFEPGVARYLSQSAEGEGDAVFETHAGAQLLQAWTLIESALDIAPAP